MKTIVKALKKDSGIRLTNYDKWLVWDEFDKEWVVYKQVRYKHHSQILIRTEFESEAIKELLK